MDFEPHAVANQHQVSGQNLQVLFMLGFMVANKIHTNIPPPHRSLLCLRKAIPRKRPFFQFLSKGNSRMGRAYRFCGPSQAVPKGCVINKVILANYFMFLLNNMGIQTLLSVHSEESTPLTSYRRV